MDDSEKIDSALRPFLTPQEIVTRLDKHIVGQNAAKRAAADAAVAMMRKREVEKVRPCALLAAEKRV